MAKSNKKTSKSVAAKPEAAKAKASKPAKSAKAASPKSRESAPVYIESAPEAPESDLAVATAPAPVISKDDIALRAYYLGEKRQKLGLPGDTAGDWIEAERQLVAEAQASEQ